MSDFPIVGIGSSAGGLEALEKLFGAMPPDSGLGFVVVAHLDPTQESHLSELLSPGHQDAGPRGGGEDRGRARPRLRDRARPGPHAQGRRAPSQQAERGAGHRRPVDTFFRSLAENGGKRAIGIVLSGTGTDGAQGLRAIKAEGGITLAQDPETADFAGMPQSAITTGAADLVLAPEKMAEALLDLGNPSYCGGPPTWGSRPRSMVSSPQCCPSCAPEPSRISAATRGPLSSAASTAAWASSKWQIVGLDDYIERLRNDPDELAALARDLTITVSGFFRDLEAWKVLDQKVIAPLVEERPAGAPIRVWVPGCATGEEAYSIAMLIVERAEAVQKSFDLKIFATDVSDHVLPAARAGLYPASIAQDVSRERLERFFDREDDSYRVKQGLRDAITLAPQNLMRDPPFSRVDVITCRNLLIYLEPEIQKKLLGLFHFALREGGTCSSAPPRRPPLRGACSSRYRRSGGSTSNSARRAKT